MVLLCIVFFRCKYLQLRDTWRSKCGTLADKLSAGKCLKTTLLALTWAKQTLPSTFLVPAFGQCKNRGRKWSGYTRLVCLRMPKVAVQLHVALAWILRILYPNTTPIAVLAGVLSEQETDGQLWPLFWHFVIHFCTRTQIAHRRILYLSLLLLLGVGVGVSTSWC